MFSKMRHVFAFFMAFFSFMLIPLIAFAQDTVPPETVDQMTGFFPRLMTAVAAGDYKVIGGIALMGIMVVIRQFVLPKAKIEAAHLPFILAAMSGFAFAGLGMLSPEVSVLDALKNGFLTAGAASMIWDLAGKYLMKLILGDKYQEPAPKLK